MAIKTNLKTLVPRREQFARQITLISRGYTNPTAWPDGKITVYPWDHEQTDWIVQAMQRLSKEELLYQCVERCCNLNGASVDDFVAEEIGLILLVSRSNLGSPKVKYTSVCPHCRAEREESIAIPDELEPVGVKDAKYPGFDEILLPDANDKVKMRPLQVRDERIIVNRPQHERARLADSTLRTIMRIITVNDGRPDSLDELVRWYKALSPGDAALLQKEGRRITPHLNTAVPHKCDECSQAFDYNLDFSSEFFR